MINTGHDTDHEANGTPAFTCHIYVPNKALRNNALDHHDKKAAEATAESSTATPLDTRYCTNKKSIDM